MVYLCKYDGESMEKTAFSSLEAAKEQMMTEWRTTSSGKNTTDLDQSDGRAACKVYGEPRIWQIIPVEAGESALVEAAWPWQELTTYYGTESDVRGLMEDFYLTELDDLGCDDTDQDNRRESFCIGNAATVYHCGHSEPAS